MTAHWGWRGRSIGVALWCSFLAACVATLLTFAVLNPVDLLRASAMGSELSSTAVYSVGFFFFWIIAFIAATLTAWMIRTERRKADFPTADDSS